MKIKLSTLLLVSLGIATLKAQTVKDIDGNVYKTVKIGTQTWMSENLKTTKFNDGTEIPLAKLETNDWANHTVSASTTPAYCWLYDSASVYKNSYGAFYNGYTIIKGNLCPVGWHVPSNDEWITLTTYLGGESVAGGKLKETGTAYWNSPNNGATNETGFAARAGGSIADNGSNWNVKDNGFFWSSTSPYEKSLWIRTINVNWTSIGPSSSDMQVGNSVRCVSDATGEVANPLVVNKPVPKQKELITFRNEAFLFEVATPGSWTFSKIVQQDPYEEMKSGKYSSSLTTGDENKVPENWNGFKLISTDGSNDPQPFLIIYAHKVGDQKPEEFATLFKRSLSRFSGEAVKANWTFSIGDAKGFDCTYGLGAKVRYAALYQNGIRVVFMYYFPSSDFTLFDKYAPEVDKVIKSLRIK